MLHKVMIEHIFEVHGIEAHGGACRAMDVRTQMPQRIDVNIPASCVAVAMLTGLTRCNSDLSLLSITLAGLGGVRVRRRLIWERSTAEPHTASRKVW